MAARVVKTSILKATSFAESWWVRPIHEPGLRPNTLRKNNASLSATEQLAEQGIAMYLRKICDNHKPNRTCIASHLGVKEIYEGLHL